MKFGLITSLAVFAATTSLNVHADNLTCPSISDITKNAHFVSAGANVEDTWILFSNAFDANNAQWSLEFVVDIKATDQSDALKKGQAYFNQNVSLTEPHIEREHVYTFCMYSSENNEKYAIAAVSPPFSFPPSSLLRFKK